MKTIKNLMFIILFATTTLFANAVEKNAKVTEAVACKQIQTSVLDFVQSDIENVNNFFYTNGINRLKSEVTIHFYVTADNKINLIKADSNDGISVDYVKQLLHNAAVNAPKGFQSKIYRMTIKLDYLAS
jgi:hypothetical protein